MPQPARLDIAVSPAWLEEHLDESDLVIADARPPEAYARGHIPQAISVPSSSLPAGAALGSALGRLGLLPDHRVVCYADSNTLPAATHLFWLLELAGVGKVRILDGGLAAWRLGGRPLATAAIRLSSKEWLASSDSSQLATADQIKECFGRPGYEILDARGAGFRETFAALDAPECPWQTEHIPHSLPVDFAAWLSRDGTFLPPSDLRAVLAAVGPRPSTPIDLDAAFFLYDDGDSLLGTLGYVLLRLAGIKQVRYYPGGWSQWARRSDLPSVRIVFAAELQARFLAEPATLAEDIPPRDFVFLDVRYHSAYDQGHIPGAVNLPSTLLPDSLETILSRYWPACDRARTVVVTYCYGPRCIRSRLGATLVAQAGFCNVEWFRGGIEAWQGMGEKIVDTPDGAQLPDLETRRKLKQSRSVQKRTERDE